jgi:hypothetical protein
MADDESQRQKLLFNPMNPETSAAKSDCSTVAGTSRATTKMLILAWMISSILINKQVKLFPQLQSDNERLKQNYIAIPSTIMNAGRLNVGCSRGFYCNASICSSLTVAASHTYLEMQSFLSSRKPLVLQYWGDSIQGKGVSLACRFVFTITPVSLEQLPLYY